jgi:hypothetical protein
MIRFWIEQVGELGSHGGSSTESGRQPLRPPTTRTSPVGNSVAATRHALRIADTSVIAVVGSNTSAFATALFAALGSAGHQHAPIRQQRRGGCHVVSCM